MAKAPIWTEMFERLSAPWIARRSPPAKCFITPDELRNAWSGRLETFLKGVGLDLAKNERGDIKKKFLKTLSILVMVRYEPWPRFKKDFLHHKDIEGTLDRTDDILPISRQAFQDLGLGLQPDEVQIFENFQYRFIPIILKPELELLVLETPRPLPFVNPDPPILGSGASGVVYKEVIAARCLRMAAGLVNEPLENSTDMTVARKTMESQLAEDEIKNLMKCRESDIYHKNILTYLCIYKTEGSTHILYKCAETDLEKLLHEPEYHSSIRSSASIIPLLSNASALAKAVQFLHSGPWIKNDGRWICCHMDLKPSNILIFKTEKDTTWKISDLGISKFQPDPNDVREPSVPAKKSTMTYARRSNGKYQAPEVHRKNKIGRPSDIWSMGCILIIITIRAVQSRDGLTKFNEALLDGHDDDFFHHDGKLKHVVSEWLSKLASKDSPYVVELTNTLKAPAKDVTNILEKLEKTIRAMLEVEADCRCDADKVCGILGDLSRGLAVISKAYPGMKSDIEAALDLKDPASEKIDTQFRETNMPLTQNRSETIIPYPGDSRITPGGHRQKASILKALPGNGIASGPEASQNTLPEVHCFVQKELLVKMKEDKAIRSFQVAQRTQSQLRDWLKTLGSALLCVSGSQGSTSMSMISKCVYAAASAHSWTAVAYISPQPGEIKRTPRDLLCRLTNSFISQLLNDEDKGKNLNPATGLQQRRTFGTGDEDISEAIQMISELLAQRARNCIFVIDNFGYLYPHDCERAIKGHWHKMLQMLQNLAHPKQQKSLGLGVKSFVRATGSVEMLKSLGATIVRVDGNGPANVNLKRSLDSCFEG